MDCPTFCNESHCSDYTVGFVRFNFVCNNYTVALLYAKKKHYPPVYSYGTPTSTVLVTPTGLSYSTVL